MKLIRPLLSRRNGALAVAILSVSPEAFAVTANVDINSFSFNPDPVVINVNDSVLWTWRTPFHNTTSRTPGLWASPTQNSGTFQHTFPTPGEFFYSCTVHGFGGVISVLGPAATNVNILPDQFDPPVVNIHPNDTVKWTWQSDFHNTASDSALWDSQVYNTGFVYEFQFTAEGSYPYSCQVHGFTGTVNVQSSTVPPSIISAPQFVPPSTFQFNYSANSGQSYVVQRSSDLSSWISVKTNVAASSSELFQDTNATAPNKFYRVFQLPNP